MAIANSWFFTKSIFDVEKFFQATQNQYCVVASHTYVDKKGRLPDGMTYTLQIIKDNFDYGVDKKGMKRDNNIMQTFDVTVLNRNNVAHKGDYISLVGYVEEYSFVIGFDIILRFQDIKILQRAKQ